MTTQVTISKTDTGDHHDIMIDILNGEDRVAISHRLDHEGGELSIYLYDGQSVSLREVPKEESAVNLLSKNTPERP